MQNEMNMWSSVHTPTDEQIEAMGGSEHVCYLKDIKPDLFDETASMDENSDTVKLANTLLDFAQNHNFNIVQPGGSLAFQFVLGSEYTKRRRKIKISIYYALSKRQAVEYINDEGDIEKRSIFKHITFQQMK